MNWTTGIQHALDYIEENICTRIDYAEVAKCAYTSEFHFQRVFSILCGYTVGDYIRMRRLTLAGNELLATNNKVIDIALKYGYDSPESFTRAFTKFHGASPAEVRKTGRIQSFSRISVKLTLIGGDTVNYRIEKKPALKVLCKRIEVAKPIDDAAVVDIKSFWKKCGEDGTLEKLISMCPGNSPMKGMLGVCFTNALADNRFPYGVGFAIPDDGTDYSESGFDIVEIPANTYAVFNVKGKMPDAFSETYKRICTEFFPQSDYEYAGCAELELYPSADTDNPNYECEVWIAVK